MATFTMELRKILGQGIDIGLKDYPIFEESYRDILNKKITDHFKYREIGFETIDMFIDRLNERMNLTMPYYNELYKSTLYEYDPLLSMRMVNENHANTVDENIVNATSTSEVNSSSTSNSKSRAVASDFPVSQLSGNQDYASSSSDNIGDTTATNEAIDSGSQNSTNTGNAQTDSTSITEGFATPIAELVLRYRETIINVDLAVIAELDPLFMQLWNTGDEYGDYPVWPDYYHWGIF